MQKAKLSLSSHLDKEIERTLALKLLAFGYPTVESSRSQWTTSAFRGGGESCSLVFREWQRRRVERLERLFPFG